MNSLVSTIRKYNVKLKKQGNHYIGLCPFHQEQTLSFSVHPVRQFYYCFGCGAKGNEEHFIRAIVERIGMQSTA